VGPHERQHLAADLLALAENLASERGHRLFGELTNDDVVEFGLEEGKGTHRCEVQVSLGGMLTVLTSNGYEFTDINNDWDVDGTPSPQVRLAFGIFDAFVAGAFRLTNGWRKPNKNMEFAATDLPVVGRAIQHGIGDHRGGPYQRTLRAE